MEIPTDHLHKMSIEEFEPMVRRVFAAPRNSIYKKRDYA